MKEDTVTTPSKQSIFTGKHRFFILIFITIVVSLTMTVVSLVVYNLSGSVQLDLSRPGYRSVSGQVERVDTTGEYNAVGPVSNESIEEFIKLFTEASKKAQAVDAFNGDPLNPETLEFSDANAAQ
jgi:hypothetical protein